MEKLENKILDIYMKYDIWSQNVIISSWKRTVIYQ